MQPEAFSMGSRGHPELCHRPCVRMLGFPVLYGASGSGSDPRVRECWKKVAVNLT